MIALIRNPTVRSIAVSTIAFVILTGALELTGLNMWIDSNPAGRIAYHLFAVLLFGVLGLLLFWPPRDDASMRPLFYRLVGAVGASIAGVHLWMLITGKTFSDLTL